MIVMTALKTSVDAVVTDTVAPAGLAMRTVRRSGVLAWTVAGAVPVLGAGAVALHLRSGGTDVTSWWLGDVGLAMTLLVPGVLIALKRPKNVVGWLLLSASISTVMTDAGREYLVYGVLGHSAPGYLWVGWFTDTLFIVAMVSLPLVLMLFPDGHAMSRRTGWLLGVPLVCGAISWFGQLFVHGNPLVIRGREVNNPAGDVFPRALTDAAINIGFPLFALSVLLGVAVLVLRYRTGSGEVRQQLKWLVWAGSICSVELVSEFVPGNVIAPVTGPIASGLLAASMCIAILRHRMFDIDLVINRTMVFAVLSVLVIGGYMALVISLGAALGRPVHLGSGLLAAALVAVTFAPARTFVQRRVDRLMYGERKNPYRVMTQLGRRLEADRQGGELAVVVDTLTQTLKLPYAAIFDASGEPLASTGTATGDVVEHPLTYQGAGVGHLLVSQRTGASGFSRDETRLLTDLARQIGAAVHAVRLSAALQLSRQRLVSAKEEERRRLRRDLHDGLGPKLAAVGLKLDATRVMVDSRPDDAKQVLSDVREDIRGTIDDIRRLVYELRPPSLDELGLVGALRDCVSRFDSGADGALVIEVDAAQDLPQLPAAVEVAAYRIVNEAVTNVVRHAHARHCAVDVVLDDALHLAIVDDGVGGCASWRRGVGTGSMAERAAELGGELHVRGGRSGRGTEVRVRIPLP